MKAGLRIFVMIIVGLTCAFRSVASNDSPSREKSRKRLEELFIWKVSDRLDLTTKEEESFRAEYLRISAMRLKTNEKLDELVEQLEKSKEPKGALLEKYKNALKESGQVQSDEFEVMRKILKDQKFSQYLVLKREMAQKIKDVITLSPKASGERGAIENNVIQEK